MDMDTVHPPSAESRKQRRMDIHDAIPEFPKDPRTNQLHVSRQNNQIAARLCERCMNRGVESVGIRMGDAIQDMNRHTGTLCSLNHFSAWIVGYKDLGRRRQFSGITCVQYCLHI